MEATALYTDTIDDDQPANGHPDDSERVRSKRVRSEVQAFLETQGWSIRQAARGVGLGASTVSQFLSGNYRGDNEAVARALRGWLRRETERAASLRREARVETAPARTAAFRRLQRVARICHVERALGVLVGEAGTGKTIAATDYARQHQDVIFIEADPGYTAKALMSEIHRAVGSDGRGTLYTLTRAIYDRLRGSGRLLMVDEAECLPYRALELLRRIHDKTGAGLLLVGLPRLLMNLRGDQNQFKQLYSRVGVKARVSAPTEEDVRLLAEQLLAEQLLGGADGPGSVSAPALEHLHAACSDVRTLTFLMRRARRIAGREAGAGEAEGRVTPEVVDAAKRLLILD